MPVGCWDPRAVACKIQYCTHTHTQSHTRARARTHAGPVRQSGRYRVTVPRWQGLPGTAAVDPAADSEGPHCQCQWPLGVAAG